MHPNKDQEFPLLELSLQKGLSLLIFIITLFYSVWNILYLKLYILGSIELSMSALSLYFFIQALRQKDDKWQHYVLVGLTTLIILMSPIQGDIRAGSVSWCLVLLIIYYMMFGSRQGLLFSLILIFPVLYILYTKTTPEHFLPYRAMINYTLAHFCVWCMCYMYESQRQKDNLRLHTMAMKDALTGVKNRHALDVAFEHISKNNDKVHILMIDIDHFKKINDKFGHDIGDNVLIEIADCLQVYVGKEDIYRLGGEEFVILLAEKSDVNAIKTAEKLCQLIEQTIFHQHDLCLRMSISIGVGRFLPGQSLNDFLRSADINLYLAKQQGRNTVCHTLF